MNPVLDPKKPTVALMVETSRAYGRDLCRGVADYARSHGEWNFVLWERDLRSGPPEWLASWKGDGIICRIFNPEFENVLAGIDCPIVDTYGSARNPKIPYLDTDSAAVAEMAARFFINAAFSSFAFCGYPGLLFSDDRSSAFLTVIKRFRAKVETYHPPQSWSSGDIAWREALHPDGSPELEAWVASLPPHTAILACNDVRAQQLLKVAARVGRKVPDDLAVMGVDNDDVICELTNPRLTSIEPDARMVGYTAAEWLDHMMQGKMPTQHSLQIPPLRIHERASTDIIASDNPDLVRALRFIRSHVQEGIDVNAVVSESRRSRSSLENCFRSVLGRSIKAEITRTRVARAVILLRGSTLSLQEIAASSGFATTSHFTRIFRQVEGQTPGSFRLSKDRSSIP